MRDNPYQVINLSNNETVEWCDYSRAVQWQGMPGFDVIYRPGRKSKKKKEFPYNG